MTVQERVEDIIRSRVDLCDTQPASLEKLVCLAYYMGREAATKEISDKYTAAITEMRTRAESCRYHKMASAIVGDMRYIYSTDYAGEMTSTFGGDPADI